MPTSGTHPPNEKPESRGVCTFPTREHGSCGVSSITHAFNRLHFGAADILQNIRLRFLRRVHVLHDLVDSTVLGRYYVSRSAFTLVTPFLTYTDLRLPISITELESIIPRGGRGGGLYRC